MLSYGEQREVPRIRSCSLDYKIRESDKSETSQEIATLPKYFIITRDTHDKDKSSKAILNGVLTGEQ